MKISAKEKMDRIINDLEIAYDIAINDEVVEILDDTIDRLIELEGIL